VEFVVLVGCLLTSVCHAGSANPKKLKELILDVAYVVNVLVMEATFFAMEVYAVHLNISSNTQER
jgi:hypothetical protein